MIYERGRQTVDDKTSVVCRQKIGGCVLYLSNRLEGQAIEEGHTAFAGLKFKSETGEPDERTYIVDCRVQIICAGPPAKQNLEDCQAEFRPYWSFQKS